MADRKKPGMWGAVIGAVIALLIALAAAVFAMAGICTKTGQQTPGFFGYAVAGLGSGGEGVIPPGAAVVADKSVHTFAVGHPVLYIGENGAELRYFVSDATDSGILIADASGGNAEIVAPSRIAGSVLGYISYLGYFLDFANTGLGLAVYCAAFVLLVALAVGLLVRRARCRRRSMANMSFFEEDAELYGRGARRRRGSAQAGDAPEAEAASLTERACLAIDGDACALEKAESLLCALREKRGMDALELRRHGQRLVVYCPWSDLAVIGAAMEQLRKSFEC